ncbi:MAG TPA: DUF3822 family protein [Paludibacter sp.]|nr:DUF3822 family protein [Paludibacter sp.]
METKPGLFNNTRYNLSIRFGSDGFSLYIRDENDLLVSSKKVQAPLFTMPEEAIALLLAKETETRPVIDRIRIIAETDNYTFVPDMVFRPADMESLLYFLKKPEPAEQVMYQAIAKWGVVNVFSLPKALYKAILNTFPEAKIEHHTGYLLDGKIKPRAGSSLHIFIRSKNMDCIGISNGDLILANSFPFATPEDFAYHALNIFEQLSLDIEKCRVYLYDSERATEYRFLLQKFIKSCETVDIND